MKAWATIKERYGVDVRGKSIKHVLAGRKGGKARVPKGFAANRELASIAGIKGGKKSKRGPAVR